jgi:hypothetical protein
LLTGEEISRASGAVTERPRAFPPTAAGGPVKNDPNDARVGRSPPTEGEGEDAVRSTDEQTDRVPGVKEEREIDQALELTFPASDPPSWMAAGGRPIIEE